MPGLDGDLEKWQTLEVNVGMANPRGQCHPM